MKKKYIVYLGIIFLIYCFWAYVQPYDYAPDEYMRYKPILYIYKNGSLPLPYSKEVVVKYFNASYAYYATFLPTICSALFMKVMSFFSVSERNLIFAARFPNIVAGVIFVYFVIKIYDELLKNKKIKILGILLASLMPEFIFLTSYINNDMMAIMSSGIIVYSWIKMIKYNINLKNSLLLSLGIIVCALSYYNAYGYILCSIFIFMFMCISKKNSVIEFDLKKFIKYGTLISSIVLVFISYFFIRNFIINKGDLLGIQSFLNACEKSQFLDIRPSLRKTPQNMGISIFQLLFTNKYNGGYWFLTSYISFIGKFGYLQFPLPIIVYILYFVYIIFGIIGYFINVKNYKKSNRKMFLHVCLFLCMIIPFFLSIKYSYSVDYQPQGRYLFPSYIAFLIFIALGYDNIYSKITNNKLKNVVVNLCYCFIIVSFAISNFVYFNSFS